MLTIKDLKPNQRIKAKMTNGQIGFVYLTDDSIDDTLRIYHQKREQGLEKTSNEPVEHFVSHVTVYSDLTNQAYNLPVESLKPVY